MNDEIKAQLEEIAKQLGGTVEYWFCCDLKNSHEKVTIKYNAKQK